MSRLCSLNPAVWGKALSPSLDNLLVQSSARLLPSAIQLRPPHSPRRRRPFSRPRCSSRSSGTCLLQRLRSIHQRRGTCTRLRPSLRRHWSVSLIPSLRRPRSSPLLAFLHVYRSKCCGLTVETYSLYYQSSSVSGNTLKALGTIKDTIFAQDALAQLVPLTVGGGLVGNLAYSLGGALAGVASLLQNATPQCKVSSEPTPSSTLVPCSYRHATVSSVTSVPATTLSTPLLKDPSSPTPLARPPARKVRSSAVVVGERRMLLSGC